MLSANGLITKYLSYFKSQGHAIIPSAPLVPENDPTVLFTTAGMHPLVPFLLGQSHPQGKRLTNVQRCIRTGDIEEVGDSYHLTFFEMLGNWSLGDYGKKETIAWSFEFLTKVLNIPPGQLHITCFSGDSRAPRDQEAADAWRVLFEAEEKISPEGKIHFIPDNWWGPAGQYGPCGPDSEMFIDVRSRKHWGGVSDEDFILLNKKGKLVEIWNDVFMTWEKTSDGYAPLSQPSIDTGMGVERVTMTLNGFDDVYKSPLLSPLIRVIEEKSGHAYEESVDIKRAQRVIADHVRAAIFILADGVAPSNKEQGYVLRRLLRRAMVQCEFLNIPQDKTVPFFAKDLLQAVLDTYRDRTEYGFYSNIFEHESIICNEITLEISRFQKTLKKGLKELGNLMSKQGSISGRDAFYIYQTYGFPVELIQEWVQTKGLSFVQADFNEAKQSHQKQSRAGSRQRFSGGLADHEEISTNYHTATHLLQAALRKVLGEHVQQKGSNITQDRLRFDFSHDAPLSHEQLNKVEETVNNYINKKLVVECETVSLEKAKSLGALAFFGQKYGDSVKVYTIGGSQNPVSCEVCGGPHAINTSQLGTFKIIKQESISKGIRRIKAVLIQ